MTDPLLRFKVEFFYPIVDVYVTQLLHDRFEDFHNYASKFTVLLPSVFLKLSKSDLQCELNCLTEIYEDDVDASDVVAEFWVLKQHCSDLAVTVNTLLILSRFCT